MKKYSKYAVINFSKMNENDEMEQVTIVRRTDRLIEIIELHNAENKINLQCKNNATNE